MITVVVLGFFLFNAQACEPRLNWNGTEKKGSSRGGGIVAGEGTFVSARCW